MANNIPCQECGGLFLADRRTAKYCSEGCRRAVAHRHQTEIRRKYTAMMPPLEAPPQRTCQGCGLEFLPKPGRNSDRQQFCTPVCRKNFAQKHRNEQIKVQDPEPRQCESCGNTFTPSRRAPHARTCSLPCNTKRQISRAQHAKVALRELRKTWIECGTCGKRFETEWPDQQKYCSDDCLLAGRRASVRRYAASVPTGVKTDRNRKLRYNRNLTQALERDEHKCRICGRRHPLEVHHVNGRGEKTGMPDHELDNLWTLCRKCHKAFHFVHLVLVDGKWHVSSKLFEKLGITGVLPVTPSTKGFA